MSDMNQYNATGRLVADPIMKMTTNNVELAEFRIAVDTSYKDHKDALFMPCNAWRGTAGIVGKYLRKGDRVGLTGELKQHNWETTEGQRRSRYTVEVNKLYLIQPKQSGSGPARVDSDKATGPRQAYLTEPASGIPF